MVHAGPTRLAPALRRPGNPARRAAVGRRCCGGRGERARAGCRRARHRQDPPRRRAGRAGRRPGCLGHRLGGRGSAGILAVAAADAFPLADDDQGRWPRRWPDSTEPATPSLARTLASSCSTRLPAGWRRSPGRTRCWSSSTTCTGRTKARSGCSSFWPGTPVHAGWRSSGPTETPISIPPTRWPSAWPSSSATVCTSPSAGWGRAMWPPWSVRRGATSPPSPERSRVCTDRPEATRSSSGSSYSWSAPVGALDTTPPSVRAVVSRRLDRLSGPTRDVLAAAAVLGADVDLSIVAALNRATRRGGPDRGGGSGDGGARHPDNRRRFRVRPCSGSRGALRRAGCTGARGPAPAGGCGAGGTSRRRPAGRSRPSRLRGRPPPSRTSGASATQCAPQSGAGTSRPTRRRRTGTRGPSTP